MAKKSTLTSLTLMVNELLASKPIVDRYKGLEKSIKQGLAEIGKTEILVRAGRVFITESEQITISPELAREYLGPLAEKVIVTKSTVSNEILNAFVKAGEVSPEQHEALLAKAQKTPKISLYVRPLK